MIQPLTIRPATPNDMDAVTRVNIETWRTAFRGIVPDAYLDDELGSPDHLTRRTESLRNRLSSGGLYGMFIAEVDGVIVGFADGGATRSPTMPFDGELYAIYVLEAHQRSGVGRRLVRAVVGHLVGSGFRSMIIWTLADSRHRSFYDRLGGVVTPILDPAELVLERGGVRLPMVAYGFPDLSRLLGMLADA